MTIRIWNGRLDATSEIGINTGLNFRQGAKVTIVSSGFAHPGAALDAFGPTGKVGVIKPFYTDPEGYLGAVLVKTGNIYTSVSGGLLNWTPPTDDNVEFVYNDRPGLYGDNAGGYDITMQYDDEDLIGG